MYRRFAVAITFAALIAACTGVDETGEPSPSLQPSTTTRASAPAPFNGFDTGWSRLPDPPLLARGGASAAWTGTDIIVAGGWAFTCPPGADCAPPEDPGFSDGAAYRIADGSWRPIADAPAPFWHGATVALDGDVFILTNCASPGCDPAVGLLRYRPTDDEWDAYPPPGRGFFGLTAANSPVVAYSTSDENDEVSDWRFDPASAEWTEIPDDPLPRSFDRHVVAVGDDLLVFASPLDWDDDGARPISGARYAASTMTWSELPDTAASGFQAWAVDRSVVINPHFATASGGVFDSVTNAWAPLPAQPRGGTWDNDLAGVLGTSDAVFASPKGWVLDLAAARWIEVQPLDDRVDFSDATAVAAVGRDLFIFGGERWTDQGAGGLLNDAWVWRAPGP